jgi:hypothetical protein
MPGACCEFECYDLGSEDFEPHVKSGTWPQGATIKCRDYSNLEAWERLRQSGSQLARPAYSRAMREVVAKRIIEMAQRGVQDRETLVEDAVRFVTTNYERRSN